ncbi:hypothetical protein LCGC14_1183310 [marine sediment metagenome]|uniref:Uncharacterized protein n=1 Tax=marine sediment metagenome TaxID=412755 RepID=A0A0F9P4C6_9ZZZZ
MLKRLKAAAEAFRKSAVEEIKEEKKTPWVKILGGVHDPSKGVKISLDWNKEFVDYLRENKITGTDDEAVVQKWVTMLFRDMMEEGKENTDETTNEFE